MSVLERSNLYVEGTDDVHAVRHLLGQHGITVLIKDRQGDNVPPNVPNINKMGGKENLIQGIHAAVKGVEGREDKNARSVGFVLDADDEPNNRWSAVRNRLQEIRLSPLREVRLDPLREIELVVPETMPAGGYIAHVEECDMRIGVWLMPDNRRAGALEQFLTDLVPQGDLLLKLAESSTEEARSKGANFPETKRSKAVLQTWLAWQEDPGLPYGSAINAQFFRHDSPAARIFVKWYERLFVQESRGASP